MDYIIFHTLTTMLRDRGYIVNDDDKLDRKGYKKKYDEFPDYLEYVHSEPIHRNKDRIIYVFITSVANKEYMRTIADTLERDKILDAIVISDDWSKDAKKEVFDMRFRINIQMFSTKELHFPIVYHIYQPKFKKLSKMEIEDIKVKYNVHDITKLPKLSIYDPVSKYYNYKEGDVIEIERDEIKKYKYYRYVQNISNPKEK